MVIAQTVCAINCFKLLINNFYR